MPNIQRLPNYRPLHSSKKMHNDDLFSLFSLYNEFELCYSQTNHNIYLDAKKHQIFILYNYSKQQEIANILKTSGRVDVTTIIHSPLIDKQVFEKAALTKFIRLKDAFDTMVKNNNKLGKVNIQLSNLSKLQIATDNGSFILQASSQISTLFYTSPLTGTYKYYYDPLQERFYSNKDGHLLDQNLSREAHKHFGDILPL